MESSISLMEAYNLRTFLSLLLFAFSLSSFSFLLISLYRKKKNPSKNTSNSLSLVRLSLSRTSKRGDQNQSHPLYVEILTSNHTPKWASLETSPPPLLGADGVHGSGDDRSNPNGSEVDLDLCGEDCDKGAELKGKKKKKRGKKKRQSSQVEEGGREEEGSGAESRTRAAAAAKQQGGDCLYPFTSAASATQRKIKQHYDQLVKSNDAKALTMAQVFLPMVTFFYNLFGFFVYMIICF